MTKSDLTCRVVQQDIRKLYTSNKIKEKMEKCSNRLGITMNHIFPVKNYHEEIWMDLPILKAIDQILNIAADKLKKQSFNSGDTTE
ncbi:hypothetical protein KOW79_020452 [Hemibagrus wyckioides]|uniref:Uncharacterized protein n=1 Tax=Hemibagrus wyckioides TaxID=337641 RepID=A0A9D3N410_9TELE|nr:hypothetical protein KOW79_020452 [Hemibagrus wyckioides]